MPEQKTLVSILSDWDLDARESLSEIERWPDEQVALLIMQINASLEESTAQSLATIQSQPKRFVLVPELRARRSKSVLRRALLYSDCVVLPVDFPTNDHAFTPAGIRMQLIEQLEHIIGLIPYLSSGFAFPIKGYFAVEDDAQHSSLVHELLGSEVLDQLVARHSTIEIESSPINAYSSSGECEQAQAEIIRAAFDGSFTLRGQVPTTKGGYRYEFPISPHSLRSRVATPSERQNRHDLQELTSSVVTRRVSQLLADWTFATQACQAALITRSEIGWKILQEIESRLGNRRRLRTERILYDLELPFLDKLSPEQILQQRDDCSDSLDAFRTVMDACAIEVSKAFESGADEREIRMIYDRHIHAPLRELDSKVREWSKKSACVGTMGVVLAGFTVTLMCGASSLLTGATMSAVISSLFGKGLSERINELVSDKAMINRSPVNLIWRIRETSVHG